MSNDFNGGFGRAGARREAIERFETVAGRARQIADAVDAFPPELRETAFWTLLNILDPEPREELEAELNVVTADRDRLAGRVDELGAFLALHAPDAPGRTIDPVAAAIYLLRQPGPLALYPVPAVGETLPTDGEVAPEVAPEPGRTMMPRRDV